MVAEAAETFGFERGEGEVDFDGEGVEEGAEPELCWLFFSIWGGWKVGGARRGWRDMDEEEGEKGGM